MNQPPPPNSDPQIPTSEPSIQQQIENSAISIGQQAIQGNKNAQIQGDNNWIISTLNVLLGQQELAPVGNPARPENQRLLLAEVKHEVTARLAQSLHNAVFINLQKELQSQQVKRPWDAEIKIGSKPDASLPDNTSILEVFDHEEIAGRLLILGTPGSGKTTTHLDLAKVLVTRAEEQPVYPIPVLFNLSSWKDDHQSINEWLVTELKFKYGVSTKFGREMIENRRLLPLLDGLDELEPARQELCIRAINQLLAEECHPQYLVICSRIEEYTDCKTRLQLNGAICLQSLTKYQIQSYATNVGYTALWQSISNDSVLLKLVQTPLILSITILAYQKISIEQWRQFDSTTDRLQNILDAYVQSMLARKFDNEYVKQKLPSSKQTRLRLIWLAQQLQKTNQTEFLIEGIQPNLLEHGSQRWCYRMSVIFIIGLILSLIISLDTWMSVWEGSIGALTLIFSSFICVLGRSMREVNDKIIADLARGSIVAGVLLSTQLQMWPFMIFLLSLIYLNPDMRIEISNERMGHIEILEFDILRLRKGIVHALLCSLIIGFIIGIGLLKSNSNSSTAALIMGIIFGMGGGLLFTLGFGLSGGLNNPDIRTKNKANQGIWRSAINAGMVTLILGLISGLVIFLLAVPTFWVSDFEWSHLMSALRIKQDPVQSKKLIHSCMKHNIHYIGTFFEELCSLMQKPDETLVLRIIDKLRITTTNLVFFSLLNIGSIGGLIYGGITCIRHFVLRLILYYNGYAPWNYARFLDYGTECLFLQRVGGRYRFIHKLLQEHFAHMPVDSFR